MTGQSSKTTRDSCNNMENVNELLTVGNITTLVVWAGSFIAPYAASYGVDKDVVTSLLFALLWLGFTVYSSANPNTFEFLGNRIKEAKDNYEKGKVGDEDLVLNDEYVSEGC